MSFRMTLYNPETKDEVARLEWLRNPFSLAGWIEDNTRRITPMSLSRYLGMFSYRNSDHVSRPTFKYYVDLYAQQVRELTVGYFCFNLQQYRQFIQPCLEHLPYDNNRFLEKRIIGEKYIERNVKLANGGESREIVAIAIPMEHFTHREFHLGGLNTLAHYQAWTEELVSFAELLQNTDYIFDCEN